MLDEIDIGDDESTGSSWFGSGGIVRTLGAGSFFLCAIALLFWNEGYSKKHEDALHEVADLVQIASPTAIDPALEGKPVHLSARVHSSTGAHDPLFGVRTPGPVLVRDVEMFQWIEYEETTGRGRKKHTTYSYEMDWDSDYWDSSQFHEPAGHENPKPALEGDGFFAEDARFGPYRFDNVKVARQALNESDDPGAPGSLGNWPIVIEDLPALPDALSSQGWFLLEAGTYYKGRQDTEDAELGDLRASFYALSNDYALSMVAGQSGDQLRAWKASNGDGVLLAEGGIRAADNMISDAIASGHALTSLLRIAGLIGAVIGAAGMARWLGSFLTMIPVVGSVVDFSLMVAGGLFGLMMGLCTIVIGWLSARPWIAALLMLALVGSIIWAIVQSRRTASAQRREKRAAALGANARQRAAERAAMPAAPPGAPAVALAGAGVGVGSVGAAELNAPPKAPARPPAAPRTAPPAAPPPVPPAAAESKELPPLEWTPGLINTKPAAVRARADSGAPAAPPPPPPPEDLGAIAFDTTGLRALAPKPAAPAAPPKAAPAPARPPAPLFDTVPAREPAAPLFDTVPMREPAAPLFDTVPMRESAAPLFDTVPMRESAAPLFDTVEPRQHHAPLFDTVEPRAAADTGFDLIDTDVRAPDPVAPPSAPPAVVAPAAPAADSAPPLRIALGSTGAYSINKIVRRQPDGSELLVCFELMRAGKPIKRGTQEAVKLALKELLARG